MPHEPTRTRSAALWGLLALLACAAVLRVHGLGAKSLWLDEAATMDIVRRPFFSSEPKTFGLFQAVMARDTHPPLYYGLLRLWMCGSTRVAVARGFSALLGVATVGILYALARVFLPRRGALVAAGLLAVSAYQVYFAQEARHYVLATFLVTLSWYFFVRLLVRGRVGRWPLWLALALTNAAALYTFYYTSFAVAAQLVVLVLLWRDAGRRLVRAWCAWQLLPVVLFAFYLPVVRTRYDSLRALVRPGQYAFGPGDLVTTAAQFACGFLAELTPARRPLVRALAAVLALVALGGAAAAFRKRRTGAAACLGWLLIPLAIVVIFPFKGHVYEPKHLIFAAPALALCFGFGVSFLRGYPRALAVAAVAALVAANLLSLVRYYDPRVEKENWRDAVTQLAAHAEPGDVVVLNPAYLDLAHGYYYTPARIGRECPPWERPDPPREKGKLFDDRQLRAGVRIWVIEAASNVSVPNRRVAEALAPYRIRFARRYENLVGTLDVRLYDTRHPAAPRRPRP